MTLCAEIKAKITGRLAIKDHEAEHIEKLLKDLSGAHVEIGTLWGGTAILAALAKAGDVYTVDFMHGGYWNDGDPDAGYKVPTEAAIRDNLKKFGVEDRVMVIKAASDPLPIPEGVKPETALIDGGHAYEPCLKDWNNLKEITKKYIMLHDYGAPTCPGVTRVVNEVAKKDKHWKLKEVVETLAVFERVPDVVKKRAK